MRSCGVSHADTSATSVNAPRSPDPLGAPRFGRCCECFPVDPDQAEDSLNYRGIFVAN
jgi:hypothetical protein